MYIASESYNNIANSTGEVIRQNRKRIFHFLRLLLKFQKKYRGGVAPIHSLQLNEIS